MAVSYTGHSAKVSTDPIINRVKRLKSLVRRPLLDVSLIEGEIGGSAFRAFVADDGSVLPYFGKLIFPGEVTVRRKGRIASIRAARLADSDADLAIVGANQYLLPLYSGGRFHFIPKWVRIFLPIWECPDTMIGTLPPSAREDIRRSIRRMKERGFDYEIIKDPSWFDRFYFDMYVQYAESRHGKLARIHSYRHLKGYYNKGFLLVIKKEGSPIAATITYRYGPTLCNTFMGVTNGDQAAAREGASTALYYYSMQYAHSIGCTGIDFGNSRPFLSDGGLRYKLKWGMQVLNVDDGIGVYAVTAPGRSEQARKFLSQNRFFQLTENGIQLCEDY